jgi:hypothetical protein
VRISVRVWKGCRKLRQLSRSRTSSSSEGCCGFCTILLGRGIRCSGWLSVLQGLWNIDV